jgi:hypothetical protein
MSATITVRSREGTEFEKGSYSNLWHRLHEIFNGHTPRAGCMSGAGRRRNPNASIEGAVPAKLLDSDQLLPGLTPGMTSAPRPEAQK